MCDESQRGLGNSTPCTHGATPLLLRVIVNGRSEGSTGHRVIHAPTALAAAGVAPGDKTAVPLTPGVPWKAVRDTCAHGLGPLRVAPRFACPGEWETTKARGACGLRAEARVNETHDYAARIDLVSR
jgi:hypothetical protein